MDAIFSWRCHDNYQDILSGKRGGLEELRTRRLPDMGCSGARSPIDALLLDSVDNLISMQVFYTALTTLAYNVGSVAHGLANNGMTTAQRAALLPNNPEYHFRYVSPRL